jgi:serine/threonine protein kinase
MSEAAVVKTLRTNPELDYTLREKLGEGSYGSVWEAQHKRTKAIVAMKVRGNQMNGRERKMKKSLSHTTLFSLEKFVFLQKFFSFFFFCLCEACSN